MSDYISLEALKGMSGSELYDHWLNVRFPFDSTRPCMNCITTHANIQCKVEEHKLFIELIHAEGIGGGKPKFDELEKIYALRLFCKALYANNPPEIMDLVAKTESLVGEIC